MLIYHPVYAVLQYDCTISVPIPRHTDITTELTFPTPWSRDQLHKVTGLQLVEKFHSLPLHVSLFWARSIQSMPPSNFLKIHFNIILPSTHSCMKVLIQAWGNCGCFTKWHFLRRGVVSDSPKPHAGCPPLVGSPRLLFSPIYSQLPSISERRSSMRNQRTRHDVVTRTN